MAWTVGETCHKSDNRLQSLQWSPSPTGHGKESRARKIKLNKGPWGLCSSKLQVHDAFYIQDNGLLFVLCHACDMHVTCCFWQIHNGRNVNWQWGWGRLSFIGDEGVNWRERKKKRCICAYSTNEQNTAQCLVHRTDTLYFLYDPLFCSRDYLKIFFLSFHDAAVRLGLPVPTWERPAILPL